jgi:hypothetical protein
LDKIYPEKKIEDLKNLRRQISIKNRAFFFNSMETEKHLIPLQEPEPEIMNLYATGPVEMEVVDMNLDAESSKNVLKKGRMSGRTKSSRITARSNTKIVKELDKSISKVDPRNMDIWQY